jgi:hypothetical protein
MRSYLKRLIKLSSNFLYLHKPNYMSRYKSVLAFAGSLRDFPRLLAAGSPILVR